jgi:hypothetical protein
MRLLPGRVAPGGIFMYYCGEELFSRYVHPASK